MNIPCELVLIDCLPCNDDPIRNISAEEPDIDVFIGFADFRGNPPLNILYAQIGCKRVCFSAVSQRDANDCAERQAAECVFVTWRPPVDPPVVPPPGGGPNNPNTPGGIPPSNPRNNRLPTFRNRAQSCTVFCPDGTPFVEEIAPGTIVTLTQIAADEMAKSLACKRAEVDKLCINTDLLTGVCLGSGFSVQFSSTGGLPFSDGTYIWNFFGELPPGLDLNGSTGVLSGTPSSSGNFTFEIEVSDANGNSTTKIFRLCVMEIVTEAALETATEGDSYTQPLLQEPAEVSSEQWTLISGTLPAGLTLNAAGSITGTPEPITDDERDFTFTLQVAATCGTGQVTCQRQFTLHVESGVDCMGNVNAVEDLVWNDTGPNGNLTMVGGDGTFSDTGLNNGIAVRALATLCNPSLDAYDITVTFDWTQTTNFSILGQGVMAVNGVDHFSPVANTSGAFHWEEVISLQSGVNTLDIRFNGSGIFILTYNGTMSIRPLTPP